MKPFDSIYKPNVLNIFCDASMYAEKYNGYVIGCSGVEFATSSENGISNVFYPNGYIPNYVVNLNTTNNNSEYIAIRQGILFAIANKNRFEEINLFSDSLISINGLTEWIDGWFFKTLKSGNDNFIMTNSNDVPVANQDLIKNIIALIYYNDLKINLYHQRGHCSNRLDIVKNTFIKTNKVKGFVSDRFIEEITTMNDIVDNRSRSILKLFVETGYAPYIINNNVPSGCDYDISKIYLKKYKYLIGKG